jgi:hypothetical protein
MTKGDSTGRLDVSNSRRSFLGRTVGVAGGAIAGLSVMGNVSASDEACPTDELETLDEEDKDQVEESEEDDDDEPVETANGSSHEQFSIVEGTPYETPVHVIDAPNSGPTAVITGGVHGNEHAGIEAAWEITEWEPSSGRLVVIPEANAVAVDQETYTSSSGDLNQQFPANQEPTTDHAQAVWDVITDYDADVVIDLHTSQGIQGSGGPSGYGQAIFPTAAGRSAAGNVRDTVNAAHFEDDWAGYYDYTLGNTMDGSNPRLIHKVGGELDRPGFLVEATRYGTDLSDQTEWLKANTAGLLGETGFDL